MYVKSFCSDSNAIKPTKVEVVEDRDADGKENMEATCTKGSLCKQGPKVKKPLHHQQRSGIKKLKENEPGKKRARTGQCKAALDGIDVGEVYMRRCKQQNGQANSASNLRQEQNMPSQHNQQITGVDQPVSRRQRRIPKSFLDKETVEQAARTIKRKRDFDISPPPDLRNGKVTKRSGRVAHRVAQEESPPLPLKLPKLHLVLTRKEIHEDWIKITGHKYTGKPRKSTLVQRGLGLCTALTCPSSIKYLNEPQ